jgi:hypothetical protein
MCISFYKGIPDCKTRATRLKRPPQTPLGDKPIRPLKTTNTGRPPRLWWTGGPIAAVCGVFAKAPASSPKWDAKIRTTQANGTTRIRAREGDGFEYWHILLLAANYVHAVRRLDRSKPFVFELARPVSSSGLDTRTLIVNNGNSGDCPRHTTSDKQQKREGRPKNACSVPAYYHCIVCAALQPSGGGKTTRAGGVAKCLRKKRRKDEKAGRPCLGEDGRLV